MYWSINYRHKTKVLNHEQTSDFKTPPNQIGTNRNSGKKTNGPQGVVATCRLPIPSSLLLNPLINGHQIPPANTIHLWIFSGWSGDDNGGEDECKKKKRPLLITGTNAWGRAARGKWSETMEHAGSEHLMEWPASRANRLFQIERNSGRLNSQTWNISPVLSVGSHSTKRERQKKQVLSLPCETCFCIIGW